MSKCVKIIVSIAILSQLVTGRSYHGYFNYNHEEHGPDCEHGHHETGFYHHGRGFHHGFHHGDHGFHGDSSFNHGQPPSNWGFPFHGHIPIEVPELDKKDNPSEHPNVDSKGVISNEHWGADGPLPKWDGERWVFPDTDTDSETESRFTTPQVSTESSAPTTARPITTSATPLATRLCIRSCPTTPEYNPVCGTNNVTYNNLGRLECAKYCGVDVSLSRSTPCSMPAPTNRPINQSTASPNNPFGQTETTISPDLLNSIFTTPQIDNNGGPIDFDIDIRTRQLNL